MDTQNLSEEELKEFIEYLRQNDIDDYYKED